MAVTDQTSPRIVLAFGWRATLAYQPTAFVKAMLDRLIPALLMPDPEAFEIAEKARQDALEHFSDSWQSDEEANEHAQDMLRSFFDEQRFQQRQVREFAFAMLFHVLERTVRKILVEGDTVNRGAVLDGKQVPGKLADMLGVLARCGYNTEGRPFMHDLHKLEVIANAVKHGHGRSLNQLAEEFPNLLLYRAPGEELTPEHLFLTAELLRELASSVAAFWEAFPSQQFTAVPET
jgi:hypothetical protein